MGWFQTETRGMVYTIGALEDDGFEFVGPKYESTHALDEPDSGAVEGSEVASFYLERQGEESS